MNLGLSEERSIYLQIGEKIEDDILRGILLEEERVPSTNELARAYAINPATAAKGINLLVDQGILYKKRGIGMFVAQGQNNRSSRNEKEFLQPVCIGLGGGGAEPVDHRRGTDYDDPPRAGRESIIRRKAAERIGGTYE